MILGAVLFSGGVLFGLYTAPDSGTEIGPNEMIVDKSEAFIQKNTLTAAYQGPEGTLIIENCSGETCDVEVQIDDFNEFHMFNVRIYDDGEVVEDEYLHPGRNQVSIPGIDVDTSLRISVPVEQEIGYVWSESYLLDFQASNYPDGAEHDIDAMVTRAIVNEEYFFTDIPAEGGSDDE